MREWIARMLSRMVTTESEEYDVWTLLQENRERWKKEWEEQDARIDKFLRENPDVDRRLSEMLGTSHGRRSTDSRPEQSPLAPS